MAIPEGLMAPDSESLHVPEQQLRHVLAFGMVSDALRAILDDQLHPDAPGAHEIKRDLM